MSRKIIGVTVGTQLPKPNFDQTDPTKGDYIRGNRAFITPDDTLTQSGRPADSKATGDAIADIYVNLETKADISKIPTKISDLTDDSSFAQTTYVDEQDEAMLAEANEYTNTQIALLLNNSSTAVDSIMELAVAMEENDEIVAALDEAIGKKADAEHNHDDKYYTEAEIDSKLSEKSNVGHDHNDVYYTETEIDVKLSDVNSSISDITSNYETKSDSQTKLDTAKMYTDTEVSKKTQVQIITWGADD